jgi:hypothetical protein
MVPPITEVRIPFARRGNIIGELTFIDIAVPSTVTTASVKMTAYTIKKK